MKNVLAINYNVGAAGFNVMDEQLMTEYDRGTISPVWTCECGALLEGDPDLSTQGLDIACDRCPRRYHNRRIGEGAWRVTLISSME